MEDEWIEHCRTIAGQKGKRKTKTGKIEKGKGRWGKGERMNNEPINGAIFQRTDPHDPRPFQRLELWEALGVQPFYT